MTASDLKYVPCEKCGGPPNTYGSRLPRTVFYLAGRVEVRCNGCGDVVTFPKLSNVASGTLKTETNSETDRGRCSRVPNLTPKEGIMKNAAKSAKPIIKDMTEKQFTEALYRHGMHPAGFLGYVDIDGGKLSVSRTNGGKTRRAQLTYLLAEKDKYEAEQEAVANSYHDYAAEVAAGETIPVFANSRVIVTKPQSALTRAVNAAIARGEKPVVNIETVAGEDVSAEIKAAEDGTGPAKAKALREAAEANTPELESPCAGCGKTPQNCSCATPPDYAAIAAEAKAPKTAHTCPDCGAEIPPRYRVCDSCLAKRRTAKKAAKTVPAA